MHFFLWRCCGVWTVWGNAAILLKLEQPARELISIQLPSHSKAWKRYTELEINCSYGYFLVSKLQFLAYVSPQIFVIYLLFILVVLFIVCMFVLVCERFKKLFVYHMMCTYYTVHGYWIVVCWLWNWSGWGCLGKVLGKETFRSKVSSCQNNSYLKSFNHTEQWEELKRNKES